MIIVAVETQREPHQVGIAHQWHLGNPLKSISGDGRAIDILAIGGKGVMGGVRQRDRLTSGRRRDRDNASLRIYAIKAVLGSNATVLKSRLGRLVIRKRSVDIDCLIRIVCLVVESGNAEP